MSAQNAHRENLTAERAQLRNLHDATRPPTEITYRDHTLKREPFDRSQSGTYRIINPQGAFVDAIEPSDFVHADDWVRYVDMVIQHGRQEAKDWLRNELAWNWDGEEQ